MKITDSRDQIQNIPGTTMGQKLESLLFWSQEEKERRFPMMQSIYPSLPVEKGSHPYPFKIGKTIHPEWDNTNIDKYILENHISGVIVIKDDKIRLEQYGKNANAHSLWTSFSVAKSVSSMLVGIALKEGYISSLDDALEKYIPELKGEDYGKVSIRQLLTMTSGIAWNEDYEDHQSDVAQMYLQPCMNNEPHILTYMKPLKAVAKPGEKWNYSTGETDLVGILLQKATGKSLAQYLSEKIWKPYGMQDCAYWLADECSMMNIGGSGLSASLRDFARLGMLMLSQQNMKHPNIISEKYMNQATDLLQPIGDQGSGYGFLWWKDADGSYAAFGIFGQMIYINPKEKLIIAQNAAWPKAGSKELSRKRAEFIKAVRYYLKGN